MPCRSAFPPSSNFLRITPLTCVLSEFAPSRWQVQQVSVASGAGLLWPALKVRRGRHAPDIGSRTRFPGFRALWIVTVPRPRFEVAEFLVRHSVEFGEELHDLV